MWSTYLFFQPPAYFNPRSSAIINLQYYYTKGFQSSNPITLYMTLVCASTTSMISPTKVTWYHVMHDLQYVINTCILTWLISLSSNRKVSPDRFAACIIADVTGNTDWLWPALRLCNSRQSFVAKCISTCQTFFSGDSMFGDVIP